MYFQPSQISYLGDPPFSKEGEDPLIGMPYATSKGTYTFRPDGSVELLAKGGKVQTFAAGSTQAKKALSETKVAATAGARKQQFANVLGQGFGKGQELLDSMRTKHVAEVERQRAALQKTQEMRQAMMMQSVGVELDEDKKESDPWMYVAGGLGLVTLIGFAALIWLHHTTPTGYEAELFDPTFPYPTSRARVTPKRKPVRSP